MFRRYRFAFGLAGLAALGGWTSYLVSAQDLELAGAQGAAAAADEQAEEGVEVLARGPIHEAFAQPLSGKPDPSPIVDKKPPEPIEELPPEAKPEGEDATWIAGYWAWDEERTDYIWISGAWRVSPPDQRFVPGYWAETEGGWQWVPGFWTTIQTQEVEYLPEAPPETLEEGPSTPAPDDDHFWIPGNWTYHETRYAWKPGYWAEVQPHWVWVPARYTWCPSGWVYSTGYWDYPFVSRGWLFSPVYFTSDVYAQPNYYYRPRIVLSTVALATQLFVRPHFHSYYFGDYYAPSYLEQGYHPWHRWGRRHYDPIYSYQRWYYHKRDRDWDRHIDRRYDYLARNANARPPRVVNINNITNTRINIEDNDINVRVKNQQMAYTLNQFTSNRRNVERVPEARQNEFRTAARELQQFRRQRAETEIRNTVATRTGRDNDRPGRDGDRNAGRDNAAAGDAGRRAERTTLRLPSLSEDQQARMRQQAARRVRTPGDDNNRVGQNRSGQDREGDGRTGLAPRRPLASDQPGRELRDAVDRAGRNANRTGNAGDPASPNRNLGNANASADAARRAREQAADARPGRQADGARGQVDNSRRGGADRTTRTLDLTGQTGRDAASAGDRGAGDAARRAAEAQRNQAGRQQLDRAREQADRANADRQRAMQEQTRDAARTAAQDRARNAQREAQQNQQREAQQQRARDQQRDAQRAIERQRGNQGQGGGREGGGRDRSPQRPGRDRDDKAMIDAQRNAAQQAASAGHRDAAQQASRDRQREVAQQAAQNRQRETAQQAARDRQREAAQQAARESQRNAAQQAARERQRDSQQQAMRQAREQQQNQARAEQAGRQRQEMQRQQASRADAARAAERRTSARETQRENPRGGGGGGPDRGNRQKDKDKDKDKK